MPRFAPFAAAAAAALALAAPAAAQSTVHVLLVLDTKARNIGDHVVLDGKALTQALVNHLPKERVKFQILQGEKASPGGIRAALNGLSVGADDTLLMLVSAHGKTVAPGADAHVLQLSGAGPEELARKDLRKMLQHQGARLTVLVTDACSVCADPASPPKQTDDFSEGLLTPRAPVRAVAAGYQKLFFEARGLVDVNATRERTAAWSDDKNGGVFLRSFAKALQESAGKADAAWLPLFLAAKKNTEDTYTEFRKTALDEIARLGVISPAFQPTVNLLKGQAMQSPQAYFLPGLRLGLAYKGTGGEGVEVTYLAVDSPLRRAGIQPGDVIRAVDATPIVNTPDLVRVARELADSNQTRFALTVRAGGAERTVTVYLAP